MEKPQTYNVFFLKYQYNSILHIYKRNEGDQLIIARVTKKKKTLQKKKSNFINYDKIQI